MSKSIYIPAFSTGALGVVMKKRTKHPVSNKLYNFYAPSKDNLFNYPYLLLSAHYGLKDKKTVEDAYQLDFKKTLLLGDSGGYQIATGALELTENIKHQIFNWLETNTNYAINLDLPPHVSCNTKSAGIFDERMEKSIENFKFFAKHQTGKTKFLNVLHGREIKLIQKWYDNVKCFNEDFVGGWAIGSCSLSTYNILLSLAFLFQNNEFDRINKQNNNPLIHILGLSKPKDMIFLMYMIKKIEEIGLNNINLSYDSSTPQTAGVRSNYMYSWTPEAFKWMQFSNQIKHEKNVNYNTKLPCSCPICKNMTLKDLYIPSEYIKDSLGQLYYANIVMHNFYKMIDFKFKMEKIINTNSPIIYNSIFSTKMLNIFKIIDKIIQNKNKAVKIVLQNKKLLYSLDDFVEQTNNSINNLF